MYRVTKNFYLEEFVPPEIMDQYGENAIQFIHPDIVVICQSLRDRFGKITINDWCFGGDIKYRGFRPWDVHFNGVVQSPHKMGLAADLIFSSVSADVVRMEIMEDWFYWYCLELRRVELGTSWLHIDLLDRRTRKVEFFEK